MKSSGPSEGFLSKIFPKGKKSEEKGKEKGKKGKGNLFGKKGKE